MNYYSLRVEAVNFSSCLFDTNDLSVIRGASLMLVSIAEPCVEALAEALGKPKAEVSPDWSGASQAEFSFEATAETAEAALAAVRRALNEEPWRHLTFVTDLAPTPTIALARNRARQFRQWTVAPCPVDGAWRQDALDRMRPADPDPQAKDELKGAVSPATRARLQHGRERRRGFLRDKISNENIDRITFCRSFEEIVSDAPGVVPEAARNKIAVLHFDGDDFGGIRSRLGAKSSGGAGEHQRNVGAIAFSEALAPLLDILLERLVGDALRCPLTRDLLLRFETLVWGGDDITIVVPAWRVLPCIATFYEVTGSWAIDGSPLGFTGAAIIANYKSPIRKLTDLADQAVKAGKTIADSRDAAKGEDVRISGRGGFTIDVFESVAPPEDGIERHRERLYGTQPELAARLSIPGSQAEVAMSQMARWKNDAGRTRPSRSRLFDLLQGHAERSVGADADRWLFDELDRDTARVWRGFTDADSTLRLPSSRHVSRSLALDLQMVCQLWDYWPDPVEPMADDR